MSMERKRRRLGKAGEGVPEWAEASAPRNVTGPDIMLIHTPGDDSEWEVATAAEIEAVQDPQSFLGRIMRSNCVLMSLRYLSNN